MSKAKIEGKFVFSDIIRTIGNPRKYKVITREVDGVWIESLDDGRVEFLYDNNFDKWEVVE